MTEAQLQTLHDISNQCIGISGKRLLGSKKVQDFMATISVIDPAIYHWWSIFDGAITGNVGEDPAITQTGNDFAKLLFQKGFPVDAQADHGTPLHIAADRGNVAIVRFLIEGKKADPRTKKNVNPEEQYTPLESAKASLEQLEGYSPDIQTDDERLEIANIKVVIDYLESLERSLVRKEAPLAPDSPLNTGPRSARAPETPAATAASSPDSGSPKGFRGDK